MSELGIFVQMITATGILIFSGAITLCYMGGSLPAYLPSVFAGLGSGVLLALVLGQGVASLVIACRIWVQHAGRYL